MTRRTASHRSRLGRRLSAPLGALATLSLLAAACSGPAEPPPGTAEPDRSPGEASATDLTVGLTYTPDIQFAPWYVAEAQGYFTDEGVEVELRHHGASESLFGALEAGEEDVVVAGGDEMLQARSQGVPVVNIATVYHSYPVALIVPEASEIETPADLAGHTVGIPGPFGETWFGLLALLADAGLGEEDVTIEHIGFTQQAALTAGHVDAVMGFVNNDAVQFDADGLPVRTIGLSASGHVPLVGIGLGASEQAITEQGEELTAVVAATQRALADIIADPQEAVALSSSYVPGLEGAEAQEAAVATLEATTDLYEGAAADGEPGDETEREEQWHQMAQFMAEHDLLGSDVAAAEAVTDTFLP